MTPSIIKSSSKPHGARTLTSNLGFEILTRLGRQASGTRRFSASGTRRVYSVTDNNTARKQNMENVTASANQNHVSQRDSSRFTRRRQIALLVANNRSADGRVFESSRRFQKHNNNE